MTHQTTPDTIARAPAPAFSTQQAQAAAAFSKVGSVRLAARGYLCVMAFLRTPSTAHEVMTAFGLASLQPVRELLQRMAELGLVHATGERRRQSRTGPPVDVWAYGPASTLPARKSRKTWPELMHLAAMLRCLEQPIKAKALAAETGAGQELVYGLLELGRSLRMIRIADWDHPVYWQGGGSPVAMYCVGSEPDAPRPKRNSPTANKRKTRENDQQRRQTAQLLSAISGRAVIVPSLRSAPRNQPQEATA